MSLKNWTPLLPREQKIKRWIIVAGHNYGQGSSREHAALCPCFWSEAVIAQSFARIHLANLINFGILPLIFKEEGDYRPWNREIDEIEVGDLGDKVALITRQRKRRSPHSPVGRKREDSRKKRRGIAFVKGRGLAWERTMSQ